MLTGMDQVAGPELVAAVTNAGGFGTLRGCEVYAEDIEGDDRGDEELVYL